MKKKANNKKTASVKKKAANPYLYGKNIVHTASHGPIKRTAAVSNMSGSASGSSGQSLAQSPLYYDYRWSSPDKYYFPRNRVVANSIWREVYKRDPAVAIATDMYADLPWSNFDLTGIDDANIRKTYEDMFNTLNLVPKLSNYTKDYLITGELVLHNIFNSTKGIWERTISHNPDYVKVEGVGLAVEQPLMWLLPTPEIKRLVTATDPRVRKLQKLLPNEILNAFRAGREVPLDPLNTTFIPRLNSSTDVRGTSIYTRLYRVVMYEDFIVNASLAVAQRNAAPLRIFKLGDPNSGWLPDADDEAAFAEMLSMAESDPLAAIIMHHNVTAELVGVSDRVLLISKEWDYIERVKLLALGVSKAFLTGESSFACFEEGTPVILHDGTPVPIEEVKTGDFVLDKDGNTQQVTNNWCEGIPEELLEVEVWGGRKFRVTPNHKFPAWMWPSKCSCGCGEDVSTPGRAFVNHEHYMKLSRHHFNYVDCPAMVHHGRHRLTKLPEGYNPDKTVEAKELRKGDFLKVPNTYGLDIITDINPDLVRLLGYYLAEGSIKYSKLANGQIGNACQIVLSFGSHEENTWAADAKSICDSLGIPCYTRIYDTKPSVCNVVITPKDKTFIDWFLKHANQLSFSKKLSDEVLRWPITLLQQLIIGYFRGDGTRKDKPSPSQQAKSKTKSLAVVQAGTISRVLATQIMLVLNKLGYPSGKAIAIHTPSEYDRKPYYIIRIQGEAAINLAKLVWDETLNAKHNRCSVWRDDKYTYLPIRSVKTVKNTKAVYNLEVENSHTYMICDGIATCNSAVAGLQTLLERLSSLRNKFEQDWMIKKLCEPIAEIHGFYQRPKSQIDHWIRVNPSISDAKPIVPKINWKKSLTPTQDVAILNIWRDLKERGIISERTYAAGAGIDVDSERKNIAEERKFKAEHPEIYGIPGQQQAKPAKPSIPGAAPPAAAPIPGASDHKNPYKLNASEEDRKEAFEEGLRNIATKDKVDVEDAIDLYSEVESQFANTERQFGIPPSSPDLLVGK